MIQEAKIMTKLEIEKYISSFKDKKKEQFDFSKYSKEIHYQYFEIERSIIEGYNEKRQARIDRMKKFEEKICDCGLKMRYIKEHGFWGCPDYQNKDKKHNTFNNVFNDYPILYDVPSNWLNIILRELKTGKEATTRELLEYLKYNHYDDLRFKYRNKETIITTDGFKKAKENSTKTELHVLKILEESGLKAKRHIYVKYKLSDENKHRVCVPDIVASLDDCVYLIEVKENEMYIDEDKLTLYFELLKIIMEANNDKRILFATFIVGNNSEKCLTLNELLESENSNDIIHKLIAYNFKTNN
jgi:Holliday junction resolvase